MPSVQEDDPPVWVEVPHINDLSEYIVGEDGPPFVPDIGSASSQDIPLKQVLGVELIDDKLYYYVEMKDGGVEKLEAEDLEKRRTGLKLIRQYDPKSDAAASFNPRTDDRIRRRSLKIRVRRPATPERRESPTRRSASLDDDDSPSPPADEYVPEGASADEPTSEEDESEPEGSAYEEESEDLKPTRRSTRLAVRNAAHTTGPQRPGPSPKKARIRTRAMVKDMDDIEEDSDEDLYAAPEIEVVSPKPKGKKLAKSEVMPNMELGDVYTATKNTPTEQEIAEEDPLHVHRTTCEKCRQVAAHLLKKPRGRQKGRQRRGLYDEQGDDEADEMRPEDLGGWLKCVRCPIVAHWTCASPAQRKEIINAVKAKTGENWKELEIGQVSAFMCSSCSKGQPCLGCGETVPEKKKEARPDVIVLDADGDMPTGDEENAPVADEASQSHKLLFRCTRCKRPAQYSCLPNPPKSYALPTEPALSLEDLAREYQQTWECADCDRWRYRIELILAWRPISGSNASSVNRGSANFKNHMSREYLVKFADRSFARCEWVPHDWLVQTAGAMLKNFLDGGRKVELLTGDGDREGGAKIYENANAEPPQAEPDAERVIPTAWMCIDRLLDVFFWRPPRKVRRKGERRNKIQVIESDDDEEDHEELSLREPIMRSGVMPDEADLESYDGRKRRLKHKNLSMADLKDIAWCYIKWEDLGYEQSTWDSPYPLEGPAFPGMEKAFRSFLAARDIKLFCFGERDERVLDERQRVLAKPFELVEQPKLGNGELYKFQLQGVSWLWMQWYQHRSSILADEMGLGKTVQLITFLAMLHTKHQAFPFLVVVPNSTLTNWVREFARWAPQLHVVPYYGVSEARKVIRDFELFPSGPPASANQTRGDSGLRAHVVVTTYETLTNASNGVERAVFFAPTRWEVLVVDESQKLKNDNSLIFKKLKEVNSAHRVLMTGTPLNNNIRELFNLMNFLDPEVWDDAAALEAKYADLDQESVKELHTALKPYFLRRIKEDELDLPPRNEVIVPLTMTTIQKELYKSILSRNAQLIGTIVGTINSKAHVKKSQLTNILMELRKCLQHPYLVHGAEPEGLDEVELHRVFTDASTKLKFLRVMLPKLKERGHRVLLFSQFVIALNMVEDFLIGEGYKYLRLDGSTKGGERQKDLDQFNREGSEFFIYILSTRAGGVGINLTSADTVIVFDPDFNPHSDHQAIARAHRIGQTKPVLVFKFMVKGSAEEKIMEAGKKKLVLDHVIVQKMDVDDPEAEDVQTILSFGAKALFEEDTANAPDVTYSEHDILNLIVKTENEGKALSQVKAAKTKGMTFDFAKVWEGNKNALEELPEDNGSGQAALQDFWAEVAQRAAEEEATRQANVKLGRGAKRAAATAVRSYAIDPDNTPKKLSRKKKGKKSPSEVGTEVGLDSDYAISVIESISSGDEFGSDVDIAELEDSPRKKKSRRVPPSSQAVSGPSNFSEVPVLLSQPAQGFSSIPMDLPPRPPPSQNENRPLSLRPPVIPKSSKTTYNLSFPDDRPMKRQLDDSDDSDHDGTCALCGRVHEPGECPGLQSLDGLKDMQRRLLYSNEPDDMRSAAFQEIQNRIEKLKSRHSVPTAAEPKEPPKKKRKSEGLPKPRPVVQAPANKSRAAESVVEKEVRPSDEVVIMPKPRPLKFVAEPSLAKSLPKAPSKVVTPATIPKLTTVPKLGVVGSSSIGSSQHTSSSSQPGGSAGNKCPVCDEAFHPAKRCPVLKNGPLALKTAIKSLAAQPHHKQYLKDLKELLYLRHGISYNYKENSDPSSDPADPNLGTAAVASNGSPLPGSTCHICRLPGHYSSTCPAAEALSAQDVQKAKLRLDKFFSLRTLGARDKLDYDAALKLLANRNAVLKAEERKAASAMIHL